MQNFTENLAPSEKKTEVALSTRRAALIVDDNSVDRRRLRKMCNQANLDFDFFEAESIADMQNMLDETTFALIFIDFRLDDGDGLGALTLIKAHENNRLAGTIMVAGVAHASVAVAALKSGCNDYVLKDALDPHWLRRAATNAVEKSQLVRAIDASEQMRATLQQTLRTFSRDCTIEMRPRLSRISTELSDVRRTLSRKDFGHQSARIAKLEEQIGNLIEFVDTIENTALETGDRQFGMN